MTPKKIIIAISFIVFLIVIGCDDEDEEKSCKGEAGECFGRSSFSVCHEQEGCLWTDGATSYEEGSCDGTPKDCDEFEQEDDCVNQEACEWE